MCISQEYAGILHVGEKERDASDKIRGFLYQDLLTIDLIINSQEEDKIYVEWVEDIFIENADTISIYQVKHYPQSNLQFQKIFKNMFYQFLKFKLFETDKKDIKTYCLYHAKKYKDIDENEKRSCIKKENDFKKIDKLNIESELEKCSDMEKREELIINEVASSNLLNEFHFEKVEKENIDNFRSMLRDKLYSNLVTDINIYQMRNEDEVKDILLAVAVQYIQESYYKKPEDFKERCMTKKIFIGYMDKIVGLDEKKCTERIKFIVLSYIDELFSEIYCEFTNDQTVKIYRELYLSTKDFFVKQLDTKESRFKLLNTISTDRYDDLNINRYLQNTKYETDRYLEHKEKIKQFIKVTWKILYNLNCIDFSQFIREDVDYFFFDFPGEKVKPVIILSPGDDPIRDANKTLPRILRMKSKPRKWYFKGKYKGLHEYSFNVNKITKAKIYDDEPSVLYKERDYFIIECMNCIKSDLEQMEKKDCDLDCFFAFECKEG